MVQLTNDSLTVEVSPNGAELHRLFDKSSKTEFLWQADPSVWGRHAPILFPIVGQVKNGRYAHEGQHYELSQHGFARDLAFDIVSETTKSVTFLLTSNSETKLKYPFDFELWATISLTGSRVSLNYKVVNIGTTTMPFSLGMHPGFACPFIPNTTFDEYELEFSNSEVCDRILLDGGLRNNKVKDNYLNGSTIPLSHDLFDDDAIIFKGLRSESIKLKHPQHDRALSVGIKGFPYLGIWSKPGAKAPFVCIEPWYGITDSHSAEGTFSEREGTQHLQPSASFECAYWIEVSS